MVRGRRFRAGPVHTFPPATSSAFAHTRPAHAGVWHLLAEVEIVFGFWAIIFMIGFMLLAARPRPMAYLDGRNYTEPLFVFAIMVVAGSKAGAAGASGGAVLPCGIPLPRSMAFCFTALAVVPLLGSFIPSRPR